MFLGAYYLFRRILDRDKKYFHADISKGHSQQWLAEMSGLSPVYISQLENCYRTPSLVTLLEIAYAQL